MRGKWGYKEKEKESEKEVEGKVWEVEDKRKMRRTQEKNIKRRRIKER